MLTEIFERYLLLSAIGGGLILLLLLLRPVTLRLFGHNWQRLIWLGALAIMLLPLSFGLPQEAETAAAAAKSVPRYAAELTAESIKSVKSFMPKEKSNIDVMKICAEAWLIVALAALIWRLMRYFLLTRAMKKISSPLSAESFPSRPRLRQAEGLGSPLLVGLLRPTIYVPKGKLAGEALKLALRHELTHCRRGDVWCKWLIMLVKTVHWFNPAVYIAAAQFDRECEISCDLSVTKEMNDGEKRRYMNTILNLAAKKGAPLTTGMSGTKNMLKRRFSAICGTKKRSAPMAAISAFTAAALLLTASAAAGAAIGSLNIPEIPKPKAAASAPKIKQAPIPKAESAAEEENAQADEAPIETVPLAYEEDEPPSELFPEAPPPIAEDNSYILPVQTVSEEPKKIKSKSVDMENKPETKYYYDPIDEIKLNFNAGAEVIRSVLETDGIIRGENDWLDLSAGYATGRFGNTDDGRHGDARIENVKCDDNGNFTLYFDVKEDTPVRIEIYEAGTGNEIENYGIGALADTAFTFHGQNPNKRYDIVITTMLKDWKFGGEYVIY